MASFTTATVLQTQITSQSINAARFSPSFEHPASTKSVPQSRQSLSLCRTFCSRLPAARGGSSRLQCSLSSENKISIAKEFISSDSGVIKPELLAAEFVFEGPVVGPLPKKEYLEAVGTFDLKKAFPDSKTNANNFLVDGDDPDLVRFTTRYIVVTWYLHRILYAGISVRSHCKSKSFLNIRFSDVTFSSLGIEGYNLLGFSLAFSSYLLLCKVILHRTNRGHEISSSIRSLLSNPHPSLL